MSHVLFAFWVKFLEPYAQMSIEAVYTLQIVGFSTGCAGCFFSLMTAKHTDWRLWFIEETSRYRAGVTRVGIWKICFPPNLKEPDNYTILCCHKFQFYEHFFPMEMKLGQILMFLGSFLAFWGLVFSFLVPWNTFCQNPSMAKYLFFTGGIFYMVSSICVFIPISWNVHSVLKNERIPFPSSFHLPLSPVKQRNGDAVYLGYVTGILLLGSGVCIIYQRILMKNIRIVPVQNIIE